jgi:hypothetical protein
MSSNFVRGKDGRKKPGRSRVKLPFNFVLSKISHNRTDFHPFWWTTAHQDSGQASRDYLCCVLKKTSRAKKNGPDSSRCLVGRGATESGHEDNVQAILYRIGVVQNKYFTL